MEGGFDRTQIECMEPIAFLWQLAVLIGLGLVVHPATRVLAVDRRRPRVENPHAESRVAVFVVLGVIVLGIFAFETMAPEPAAPGSTTPGFTPELALRTLAAYGVTSLPLWVAVAVRGNRLATLGIGRQNFLHAILLGFLMGAVFSGVTIALDPASAPALEDPSVWLALAVFLGAGFFEEVIFRGYLQARLSWAMGPIPALVIAAGVMAVSPLPRYLLSQQLTTLAALEATGLMLAPSLLLGFFMMRVQNVAGPATLHAFIRWSLLLAVI